MKRAALIILAGVLTYVAVALYSPFVRQEFGYTPVVVGVVVGSVMLATYGITRARSHD